MQTWLRAVVLCCALICGIVPAMAETPAPLRIGLTPVFLDDQTTFVNAWRDYLAKKLGRPVEFVQRSNYREITDLLRSGKLEFAWICGFPYVRNRDAMTLLAVPVYKGAPTYRSYLIVPATDRQTTSMADLKGKVFAFSDQDSNSGYLVPVYELAGLHQTSPSFFAKSFFTWSHRNVVQAVADGLAEGGAVDGYVWDILALQHPDLTARTRIVRASAEYGFPPFVAAKTVAAGEVDIMRQTLIAMPADEEGARLLGQLHLDGFVAGEERLFDGITEMMRATAER